MATRKKTWPLYEIGDRVSTKRDCVWYSNGVNGLTEDVVLWPAGSVGTIVGRSTWSSENYIIRFDEPKALETYPLHAASIDLIEPVWAIQEKNLESHTDMENEIA